MWILHSNKLPRVPRWQPLVLSSEATGHQAAGLVFASAEGGLHQAGQGTPQQAGTASRR